MTSRRRGSSPPAPPSPLEDDDLLWEILLRLPPQPSTLPRASAVCKCWRRVATDPKFIAGFRAHHRKPPLLGVFHRSTKAITFNPILDPPDRIPTKHFDLDYNLLGCRHGRVLTMDRCQTEIHVHDPVTGQEHHVAVPREVKSGLLNGAVFCPAADDQGHVHSGCCPFKVVLMTTFTQDDRPAACVYSSETGIWGGLVKTADICDLHDAGLPGTLVGHALYWLQVRAGDDILVFDLDEQNLALIRGPPIRNYFHHGSSRMIRVEDGAAGLAVLSYPRFEMWRRNVNSHGAATWVLWKTVEMHNVLGLPPDVRKDIILGYCEHTDAFFLLLEGNVYMVQLKSMQSRRLYETQNISYCHPFTSFYTPGIAIAGGHDGADLHDMLDDSVL